MKSPIALLIAVSILLLSPSAHAGRRVYGVSGNQGAAVAGPRGVAWSGENSSGAVTRRGAAVSTDNGVAVASRRGVAVAGNNGVAVATRPALPRGYISTVPVGASTFVYGGYNCYFVGGLYYRPVFYQGTTVYVVVN